MQRYSTSPKEVFNSFWRNRSLIKALVKREIIGRYRGSMMGIAWSFFNPLLMLLIYTVVFSGIFNARWTSSVTESKLDFAINLFVGLIVHGLFSECVNRAPGLIVTNVNYVKKVIFPLEILPWAAFFSALFHTIISILVLLLAQAVFKQQILWTTIFLPIVIFPLLLGTMGLAWFLAAIGVYLRDVGQVTGMFTTAMLFMSAVFFPVSSLSEKFQFWMQFNPLAVIIQAARQVLVHGQIPDFSILGIMLVLGAILAWAGFACFQYTRTGFADVL